ncbi:MAG: arginine--tRNA ligase [Candidatus Paceibacterota bacterium]|nr:MAG: arginine--tRNA ligase [Candidatus Paceibacterota bacterium]
MYSKTLATIRSEIAKCITDFEISTSAVSLDRTPSQEMGDVTCNIALKYSKNAKISPFALANKIAGHLLSRKIKDVKTIEVIKPGFINITFSEDFFSSLLKDILNQGSGFGSNTDLSGEKWVVEHTSPNPNKAMHLGHLRNNLVGMGLVRLLKWNGASVVSDAVDNNRGIAIAKLMWGFLAHMRKKDDLPIDVTYWISHKDEWLAPSEIGIKPDLFVTKCYVLGESDFKQSSEVENKVRNFVVEWENHNEQIWNLWSHVLNYAYEGMNRTLSRLENHWDVIWHEHEHYQSGKEYVERGLKEGIFKQLEDGAILTDLSAYNISDTILLKRDGTSLYITQDIALTVLKKNRYGADKLVWVIGPEQSLAMKQLFAVCEQLGIGDIHDFTHIPYGYVGLKGESGGFKKMSSREGTVVLIDDVIDQVKEKIHQRFLNEGKVDSEIMEELSERLAIASVKFALLKPDRTQDITFDTEKSIETSGDSGIYILYTYVRTQSILRKKEVAKDTHDFSKFIFNDQKDEKRLLWLLLFLPDVIKMARSDLSVHGIAQYLLEICSAFNSWYAKEPILDGSPRENYKLALTKSVGIVIKNGLSILGVPIVEEI